MGIDPGDMADIPLFLADADRALDDGPNNIEIGMIHLRPWQVYRLPPLPPGFGESIGYLVQVNYEFDIAAGVPAPAWAEVAFTFPEGMSVVDAVPRGVTEPEGRRSYKLSQHLHFIDRGGTDGSGWSAGSVASDMVMPPVQPRIDCFGLGDRQVRWRHTSAPTIGVPVGSHAGWFVLLAPADRKRLPVLAAGHYHLETDPALALVPSSRRDAFVIRLPLSPAISEPATSVARARRPRVFISYSQESAAHKADVVRLWKLLESQGVDVGIDQEGLEQRRIWTDWTNVQILRSDYVIVVASPAYLAASEARLPPNQNLGVRSEYLRLADLLHRDTSRWTKKILPVVLPGRSVAEIPLPFLPGTADHYIVDDFTPEGAASLLAVILHKRVDD